MPGCKCMSGYRKTRTVYTTICGGKRKMKEIIRTENLSKRYGDVYCLWTTNPSFYPCWNRFSTPAASFRSTLQKPAKMGKDIAVGAPKQGGNPQQKFFRQKGFYNIVICSSLKAYDFVAGFNAGGQKQNFERCSALNWVW